MDSFCVNLVRLICRFECFVEPQDPWWAEHIYAYIHTHTYIYVHVCFNSISVTIGPPENILVTPGEGSLIVRFTSPFEVDISIVTLQYYIHYSEKEGIQEARMFFSFVLIFSLQLLIQ